MATSAPLSRRALFLSYFTVAYNLAEGLLSLLAGALAGSIALVGFGLDSAVESASGALMIWRFRRADLPEEESERREARATRLVGYTFFLLAAYVLYECAEKLLRHEAPAASLVGIGIAFLSLILMPILSGAKRRTGESLGSRALVADSRETLACAWLSAALLVGLGLNYLWGLWWADPVAGLVVVGFLVKEGRCALRGEECEACCGGAEEPSGGEQEDSGAADNAPE
jgi:divalent metal cation (Fe/Co/Zn/Cd) transporter